jgi:rod shape-determining protein MreC
MFFLFIFLEAISILFVVKYNGYQKSVAFEQFDELSGNFQRSYNSLWEYFNLRKINHDLAEENARYRKMLPSAFLITDSLVHYKNDTLYRQQYQYVSAQVISNSTNTAANFIQLDKGRLQGIGKDMAVINPKGIVGTVVNVSDNFAWVMSVLNKESRISARIKKNSQIGTIAWEGGSYLYASLKDIPTHVSVIKGDTVYTSGFSHLFPKGEMVGTISQVEIKPGDHFYTIQIRLAADFNSLGHVYVVKNLLREEQMKLQETTKNE